ncbi:hypothetical protein GCM10011613_13900 [Cellvibrio zantedeschiae]|uniref:Tetratricopeptide repeat protein n=1 Tax=Cellvibrio zantedeschiae TaxID=1237077 RepID=A0ABQ3B0Z0_9GAMM|nr:tetratricopeptide repeat protein [Cellvibrio zantedeschiae]GGY70623.1 hypothetical protein GCM10011613_13900 [Cellvibrio zantedeschiae]
MKSMFALLCVLGLAGCATGKQNPASTINDDELLRKGTALVANGSAQRAINEYFNPIIERCNTQKANYKGKIYAARNQVETIFYLGLAGAENVDAQVISATCPEALFMKAYSSFDLGQLENAIRFLNEALEWSPLNANYLAELGNIYQTQRDWNTALEKYSLAEDYALTYSPESIRTRELARAKRGVGFVLIELGRLDEAEKKFKECLELDKNDKNALNELEYIKQLKSKDKKAS